MTSFSWKRKAGQCVNAAAVDKFTTDSVEDHDDDDVVRRKHKVISLEDSETKRKRLTDEGCLLAESGRPWEAIRKWDEAISLSSAPARNGKLYEMKAQVLMGLGEELLAIQAAQQAIQSDPTWWVSYQTLGRAQLGIGEVNMAIRSFCKACHLNPTENDLWLEDLWWAVSLRERAQTASKPTLHIGQPMAVLEGMGNAHRPTHHEGREAVVAKAPTSTVDTTDDAKMQLSINSWIRMRVNR